MLSLDVFSPDFVSMDLPEASEGVCDSPLHPFIVNSLVHQVFESAYLCPLVARSVWEVSRALNVDQNWGAFELEPQAELLAVGDVSSPSALTSGGSVDSKEAAYASTPWHMFLERVPHA